MAAVTTTALAPCAPSPPSVSVFFSRAWMLSIVFLQLMKRSKFSFTCAPHKLVQHPTEGLPYRARMAARNLHQRFELPGALRQLVLQVVTPYPQLLNGRLLQAGSRSTHE